MYLDSSLYFQKFGRLTTLYPIDDYIPPCGTRKTRWLCICECGNCCAVNEQYLKNGTTQSCGCYRREITSKNAKNRGVHYEAHSRLYNVWCSMRDRCYNSNHPRFKNYGGRGIKVCDEWLSYVPFRDWSMEHGYDPDAKRGECTLDRRDVNGDYCPENCQWVDMLVQQNNRTNNRKFTWNGETKTIKQWADELGIDRTTITYRIDKSGMTFEDAITIPIVRKERWIECDGETHTINQWSKIIGLGPSVIRRRIDELGWSVEEALKTPAINNSVMLTYNGETLSRGEWARRYNINSNTLRGRLDRGWSVEDALTTPVGGKRKKAG